MGTLTKNFNWFEVTRLQPQTLSDDIRANIKKLAVEILQPARDNLQKPIHINSWYRDPIHNASIGGASNSQHLYGDAVDIYVDGFSGLELFDYFVKNYGNKLGGIGLYYNENEKQTFIHIDQRKRLNNSITAWYQTSSGVYTSPNKAMVNIFTKYNCKWEG